MENSALEALRVRLRTTSKYNEKWDILKPLIEHLFLKEGRKLKDICSILKRLFDFPANEHEYKYYIHKKWKLHKNLKSQEKDAVISFIQTRASINKTTVIEHDDPKFKTKLRRHLKDVDRKQRDISNITVAGVTMETSSHTQGFSIIGRILMEWNSPYGPTTWLNSMRTSNNTVEALTPPGLIYHTPQGEPDSPFDAPSPLTMAIKSRSDHKNTQLLVQGKFDDLLGGLGKQDKTVVGSWMYQFWLHSYKLAKTWGMPIPDQNVQHPKTVLDTNWLSSSHSPPNMNAIHSTYSAPSPGYAVRITVPTMSSLCFWAVHIAQEAYIGLPQETSRSNTQDHVHEASKTFTETLLEELKSNEFSDLSEEALPLSVPAIIESIVSSSNSPLYGESVGHAIMSRNVLLLDELIQGCYENGTKMEAIEQLHPFHLAATYLDGAKACCLIFDSLLSHDVSIRELFINQLGYTVIDSLLLTILRSHSSCSPEEFDTALRYQGQFRGQEVDICGRWDADSESFLSLQRKGIKTIPSSWKHKFCHTSAQVICHVISLIFAHSYVAAPDIDTESGLCSSLCTSCGRQMRLSTLHVVLIVAFKLSTDGRDDEDLFGILAVLLCLISNGANPSKAVHVPSMYYKQNEDEGDCNHTLATPVELCHIIISAHSNFMSPVLNIGWALLGWVLQQAANEWLHGEPETYTTAPLPDSYPELLDVMEASTYEGWPHGLYVSLKHQIPCYHWHGRGYSDEGDDPWAAFLQYMDPLDVRRRLARPLNYFGQHGALPLMWASIQTELLTYRRIIEGDAWISSNFNMKNLLDGLLTNGTVSIKLVTENMMKPACRCGRFIHAGNPEQPAVTEVCNFYFSNHDIHNRTTYIESTYYGVDFC